MLAVRYVTLAALVVWLGGMTTLQWMVPAAAGATREVQLLGCVCAAIILVGLFVLKFVGPPPHGFIPRAALAAVGLLLAIYGAAWSQAASAVLRNIQMLLCSALLFWYVKD